jgi:hypothetical protein
MVAAAMQYWHDQGLARFAWTMSGAISRTAAMCAVRLRQS